MNLNAILRAKPQRISGAVLLFCCLAVVFALAPLTTFAAVMVNAAKAASYVSG